MTIDLTKQDIELISKALESYETNPMGLASEILMTVLAGRNADTPQFKKEREERMTKEKIELDHRKTKCLMLRARLMEVMTNPTEHTV